MCYDALNIERTVIRPDGAAPPYIAERSARLAGLQLRHMRMRTSRWIWTAAGCLPAAATMAAGVFPESLGEPAGMTHRMMMLAIQLGVLLFAARLGNGLFERLKLPGVLGEVAAGMAIGPFALGRVPLPTLGFPTGLFPMYVDAGAGGVMVSFPVSPELYGFCAVASIILLFLVGLETDLSKFLRYSLVGTLVGLGGVLASFGLGAAAGWILLPRLAGGAHTFLSPGIVFLGILSTATSVGITARILSDKRKLDSPEGVTILAGAVIDDVLGILLLAIGLGVIASTRGGAGVEWAAIGRLAIKTVGIWLAATATGLLASRRISALLKLFHDRMSIAVLALGMALILAGLFEEARLAMIIGAYVMGLSLSRSDISRLVAERLHAVHAFFVPIFFAVMGMLVDLSGLGSPAVLTFGAAYTLLAIVAKVAGCGLPALACNFNWLGAARIGVGMVPRGEVALIIAGIGLSGGILTPEIFGVGVMMTLITTMVAPPLLVALFRTPRAGVRRAAPTPSAEPVVYEFPSPEAAELIGQRLLAILAGEGFFAHKLDPLADIYQLRKDEVVFGFRRKDRRLVFECNPNEVALIGTAMMEVVADFERLVSELRKPLDRSRLPDHVAGAAPPAGRLALIEPHLQSGALTPHLRGATKAEVIEELLRALMKAGAIKELEGPLAAVWERERVQSTGLQHGIATPHGRTDHARGLVFTVGLSRAGVNFDSMDGCPARIVILTLCPQSRPSPYVQLLAQISQRMTPLGRLTLLACETPDQMREWFLSPPEAGELAPSGNELAARLSRWPLWRRRPAGPARPDLVVPDVRADDAAGVLRAMVDAVRSAWPKLKTDAALETLLRREREVPSGLERGLAVPHAKVPHLDRPIYALGLLKTGIEFGASDGQPIRVVLLCLYPASSKGALLREVVPLVARIDEVGTETLAALDADTASAALAAEETD